MNTKGSGERYKMPTTTEEELLENGNCAQTETAAAPVVTRQGNDDPESTGQAVRAAIDDNKTNIVNHEDNDEPHHGKDYLQYALGEELDTEFGKEEVEKHLDHRFLTLSRLSLTIKTLDRETGHRVYNPILNEAFRRRNADRYLLAVRWSSIFLAIANVIAAAYDQVIFEDDLFWTIFGLRISAVPVFIGVILFTYTQWYWKKADMLAIPIFVIGVIVVTYTVLSREPGKFCFTAHLSDHIELHYSILSFVRRLRDTSIDVRVLVQFYTHIVLESIIAVLTVINYLGSISCVCST